MFIDSLSDNVRSFVAEAMPYSNWGQTYFDIRLMELVMADSMFGDMFSNGRGRALDIGCGIGLASVFMADHFDQVDGTDIDDVGVAFRIDKAAPWSGPSSFSDSVTPASVSTAETRWRSCAIGPRRTISS